MLTCPHCGRAVEPGTVSAVMASVNRTEPFAIASIVCAVGNFVGAFFVGAILAIIFGRIAGAFGDLPVRFTR